MLWKIITFSIATLVLVYISRASVLHPRSHGFHRFFAWEAILALFLLNVDMWFTHPFAWYQVISWFLLVICIILLVWGVILLRQRGKPVEQRTEDPNLLAFEKTTNLVTTGIYNYIRHPLYSSLLLLAWGIFFKSPSWAGIILVVVVTGFLVLTARADETECVKFFGTAYEDYMKKSKRFIPFLF